MKLSLLISFLATAFMATTLVVAHPQGAGAPSSYPSFASSEDDVVNAIELVQLDIQSLATLFETASITPDSPPDFSTAEQLLFQLAQDIDSSITYLQGLMNAKLSDEATDAISGYLSDSDTYVQEITDGIIAQADVFASYGVDTLVAKILNALTPGFDKMYRQLAAHLYANAAQTVAPYLLSIICNMDNAANALLPGSGVTDEDYCNSCQTGPWPDYPTDSTPFSCCDDSCSSTIKYGYENDCYSSPDACSSGDWCAPPFEPCTSNWQPSPWYCSAANGW